MNIISVATWHKRFSTIGAFLDNFSDDFYNRYHVILNMTVEDFEIFPKAVYNKYKDKVEFLTTEINYGSTNKLLPMLKYKNDTIMTLDDDSLYNEDVINEFWKKHNKDCINGLDGGVANSNQPFLIWYKIGSCYLYKKQDKKAWKKTSLKYGILEKPRNDILLYGYAGVIYPPNILKLDEVDIEKEWTIFKQADDEWVFKRSLELNINKYVPIIDKFIKKKDITNTGAVSDMSEKFYEKCRRIYPIIYPLCKDFENNINLTIESCKTSMPCIKKHIKTGGKYTQYVKECEYYGFENIWDKYMPEAKRRKMMILLHKDDTVIEDFLE